MRDTPAPPPIPAGATLRDVARGAGVSIRTVRRVIQDEPYVAVAVRDKVRQVLAARGYQPDPIARSLRTRTSADVAALVLADSPIIGDIHTARILAFESLLWEQGYALSLRFLVHDDTTAGRVLVQGSLSRRPAGVAVFMGGRRDPRRLAALLAGARVPCVVVDPADPGPDSILVDRPRGVDEAVHYLAARGRKRIAYLGQKDPTRLTGYLRALKELGLPPLHVDLPAALDRCAQGREAAATLAGLNPRPDAVQVYSDEMAMGLLAGFHDLGIRVPDDVAVVGFDDRRYAAMSWPRLTTLAQPNRELGAAAARMLLDRIAGRPARDGTRTLPMRLVVRESA